MYKPTYRTGRNGVPILGKNEIDEIAENFIRDFCPGAMRTPMKIDIDSFAQNYLGLKQDFQYLSHNGVYLGMTVFNDTDKVVIFNPETWEADYISVEARTIIIDNNLLEENQEHRYRYTMGHECGHDIYHTQYFGYAPDQMSFLEEREPMIRCRIVNTNGNKKPAVWDDKSTMEWQANYMSSALLMPKSMVNKIVKEEDMLRNKVFKSLNLSSDELTIIRISRTFNVSEEAARYRLQGLGLIENNSQFSIQ
jgi:Zn-dependent peptidase ImmA (M78 family)